MGHKIFISYKYHDNNVKSINSIDDTVRDYVDLLEEYVAENSEHIYKGESDDEDLSELEEDTLWEKLKERIYDSTLTIIMISKGMKKYSQRDRDQWIPWEVSYSLKEVSRKNKAASMVTSASNALLSIVLPDKDNSYSYFINNKSCCEKPCRILDTQFLFKIMSDNMFNIKKPDKKICDSNSTIYYGDSSYISTVKWCDFIKDPEKYISKAYAIQSAIEQYNITKEL